MTFRQYQQDVTPLRGPAGSAWAAAHGETKDGLLARAVEAINAGAITRTPADGLARLGADADVERAPGEADADYRARIAGAWESWSWAGTKYGIGAAIGLLGFGYPNVWSYRELPPDSNVARWARVVIIFRGLPAWDGSALWDGEDTWDSLRSEDLAETADADDLRSAMRRVARKWVNARDIVERVTVTFGGLLWDLDGLWDGDDVWDEGDGETAWGATDGETAWGATEWDTSETGAEWDSPLFAWDAFC